MNRSDYISEVKSQLSDATYYMQLDSDPTIPFKMEVDSFLQESHQRGFINQTELKFLTNEFSVTPVMYALPKVHKYCSI